MKRPRISEELTSLQQELLPMLLELLLDQRVWIRWYVFSFKLKLTQFNFQIQDQSGKVLITNDGATILDKMSVIHPTAKMLVEISKAQDIEAGDGTTSVVVMAGALLKASEELLNKGIHPAAISDGFGVALNKAKEIIDGMG